MGLMVTREDGTTYNLKLASFNLGASEPYGNGDWYAWGETITYYSSLQSAEWKTRDGAPLQYSWDSYIYTKNSYNTLTKYCYNTERWAKYWAGSEAEPDGLTELLPDDDVAHVKLGGKWRMPTSQELQAVVNAIKDTENYLWEKISVQDAGGIKIKGWKLTRKSSGNSVFFPAAGFCFGKETGIMADETGAYWSSSLYSSSTEPSNAAAINLNGSNANMIGDGRFRGKSIRPVCD